MVVRYTSDNVTPTVLGSTTSDYEDFELKAYQQIMGLHGTASDS